MDKDWNVRVYGLDPEDNNISFRGLVRAPGSWEAMSAAKKALATLGWHRCSIAIPMPQHGES